MALKVAIVGLPNVGKSTLFNALTKTAAAQAANYPFCTIEPNTGDVAVPEPRLNVLAEIASIAAIEDTAFRAEVLRVVREGRAWLTKELGNLGVTVTTPNAAEREAFVKATRPVYDKWKNQIGAQLVDKAEKAIAASQK